MTIETVKQVVSRFICSDSPEVLVLKGAWGVGKTFAWNSLLIENQAKAKLKYYSYVSLFGVASIKDLRTAIFAKKNSIDLLGRKLDFAKVNENWFRMSTEWTAKKFNFLSRGVDIPILRNVSIGLETLAMYMINDTIICLDDFERMDQSRISHEEILGLMSELKEEKNCKVVLIFNQDELKPKDLYDKYKEKIVDLELLYSPTPLEAVNLALTVPNSYSELIKKNTVSLGITNIRILKKISNYAKLIYPEINHLHPNVLKQGIQTLVLYIWCYYDINDKKPSMDFVLKWNSLVWAMNNQAKDKPEPESQKWADILQEYEFTDVDDFDLSIYKLISHGYLEETGLQAEAVKLDEKIRNSELEGSFAAAWRLFHDTFDNNEPDLVKALKDSFTKSVQFISPLNLSGTTCLLRQLGHEDIANELIEIYLNSRDPLDNVFDLDESPFSGDIKDPLIIEAFKKKLQSGRPDMPLAEAVSFIAKTNGWSKVHIQSLTNASEDEYYNLFKQNHDGSLSRIVKSCTQFKSWDDENSVIGDKAYSALTRIAKESNVNAIRAKRYGVDIVQPEIVQDQK